MLSRASPRSGRALTCSAALRSALQPETVRRVALALGAPARGSAAVLVAAPLAPKLAALARPREATIAGVRAAAAYLRVSTHAQDWKLQRDALRRALKARGDRVAPSLWFEEKRSGSTLERPALQRLRAAVRAGRVGRVYVFRIDRLTRSGIRDTLSLVEEFRRGGAELVTLADGFDLQGPAADVVLAVLAWAAQMERNAIGERIRAARRRVEAKGGAWGRPRVVSRATIARAQKMRAEGATLRAVCVALKVKRSTLSDALSLATARAVPAARNTPRRTPAAPRARAAGGSRRAAPAPSRRATKATAPRKPKR